MKALVLTLLFLLIVASEAKVFSKCELALGLKQMGLDGYHGYSLGNWFIRARISILSNERSFRFPQIISIQETVEGAITEDFPQKSQNGKVPLPWKPQLKKREGRRGMCMAYHESRYNSQAVGPPNWDGSHDYGIFQINSQKWCNNYQGHTANGCNKTCSAFINDDITDDIECAKRIVHDPQGMDAWVAWRNNCKGRNMSQWTHDCQL